MEKNRSLWGGLSLFYNSQSWLLMLRMLRGSLEDKELTEFYLQWWNDRAVDIQGELSKMSSGELDIAVVLDEYFRLLEKWRGVDKPPDVGGYQSLAEVGCCQSLLDDFVSEEYGLESTPDEEQSAGYTQTRMEEISVCHKNTEGRE